LNFGTPAGRPTAAAPGAGPGTRSRERATEPLLYEAADLREARTRASCSILSPSFANNEIEPTSTDHEDAVR
jgi:hypothetical protein